jgi:hypothetical protein
MDGATFRRGRYNPFEGGPKGLDIDAGGNVLVVTSEFQPLAFFGLSTMLGGARAESSRHPRGAHGSAHGSLHVRYELEVMGLARRARRWVRDRYAEIRRATMRSLRRHA